MKYLPLLLLIMLPLSNLPAQAESLEAKVDSLLKFSGAEAQFITVIDQMIGAMKQNPAYSNELSATFWEEFTEEIHATGYADLKPKLIQVYLDNYTEAEIDHQLAYFSHPMTKAITAKQPVVMQASMQVGQAWGQAIGTKIVDRLTKAMEDRN